MEPIGMARRGEIAIGMRRETRMLEFSNRNCYIERMLGNYGRSALSNTHTHTHTQGRRQVIFAPS